MEGIVGACLPLLDGHWGEAYTEQLLVLECPLISGMTETPVAHLLVS